MLCAQEIYQQLLTAYGRPRWWSNDPFIVMIQSILVQHTTWNTVEKTCAPLGDRLSPECIDSLSLEGLEELIIPCGFQKAKARAIKGLTAWFRQYHFDRQEVQKVPLAELREELLALRGVGAETADVILVYAFYRPSFIIDAYTRRLLTRLGHDFLDDDAIRQFFETGLPQDAQLYGRFHWLILDHCISVCRKRPKCQRCPFQAVCEYRAEEEPA